MITPDSNWLSESKKQASQPVFLCELETQYQQGKITLKSDWEAGVGNADFTTREGSLICRRTLKDIIAETNYGFGGSSFRSFGGYTNILGVRMLVRKQIKLIFYGFSLSGSGEDFLLHQLLRIKDSLGKVEGEYSNKIEIERQLYTSEHTSSFFPTINKHIYTPVEPGNIIEPGVYMWLFKSTNNQPSAATTWRPNQPVFSDMSGALGLNFDDLQLGACNIVSDDDYDLYDDLTGYGGMRYIDDADRFNGDMPFHNLEIYVYDESSHTSIFFPVQDQNGNNVIPSAPGQFRAEQTKPNGTSITYNLFGSADAVGTGETDLGIVKDGDSIAPYPFYKVLATLGTMRYFETPEMRAVSAYFNSIKKFVKADRAIEGAHPIIKSLPSFEPIIEPDECKVSISEPAVVLEEHKIGVNKTIGAAHALLRDNLLVGSEMKIKFGFQGIETNSFIPYGTGIIKDYSPDWNLVKLMCKDVRLLSKDFLKIDSATGLSNVLFNYTHPVDAIYEMIAHTSTPERLLNIDTFDAIKASMPGWEVFRYVEKPEEIDKLIQELCLICGFVYVPLEDGRSHLIKLNDTSKPITFDFSDDNSAPDGMSKPLFADAINVVRVQRGYWDESQLVEYKTYPIYDTVIHYDSSAAIGINEPPPVSNKWLPRYSQIDGKYLSQIVGERLTSWFGWGMCLVSRKSVPVRYANLQVGDEGYITTDQIIYKGIYGQVKRRAVLIRKTTDETRELKMLFWIPDFLNDPV